MLSLITLNFASHTCSLAPYVYFLYYPSTCAAATLVGLREEITEAIKILTSSTSSISVASGSELFLRFITLTSLDHPVSKHISYAVHMLFIILSVPLLKHTHVCARTNSRMCYKQNLNFYFFSRTKLFIAHQCLGFILFSLKELC